MRAPSNDRPYSWKKLAQHETQAAVNFLLALESSCVTACSRFINRTPFDKIWRLGNDNGDISALLIYSHSTLFPVFDCTGLPPAPHFLHHFPQKLPPHAIQGRKEDVELLVRFLKGSGHTTREQNNYELMSLDRAPLTLKKRIPGLTLRRPVLDDTEAIFHLHAAYEQEEVISRHRYFNPASCRLILKHILTEQQVLVAELDGRLVGKINTNAQSFTRSQIGGVYVLPEYRSLGIGSSMTEALAASLIAGGKGVTLFARTHNIAACKAYRNVGFTSSAAYRIVYYST